MKRKRRVCGTVADWAFTTADITPPTIVALSPSSGGTRVAVTSPLVLTFDEPVVTGTGTLVVR